MTYSMIKWLIDLYNYYIIILFFLSINMTTLKKTGDKGKILNADE